jgi:RNA polymerase sigma-70 factor (ECF subfamily)
MIDERSLIQRASRLEQEALVEVFDCYHAGIYRYAIRLTGDAHLAEECTSETFLRYLRALHNGAGPREHLQAYLYRIAHNWITDHYRSNGSYTEVPLELDRHEDLMAEPAAATDNKNERNRVRAALKALTPDQRQVVTLKYIEGWDNDQIAQTLQKPVGAVKSLQHRALGSLRRLLSETEGSG